MRESRIAREFNWLGCLIVWTAKRLNCGKLGLRKADDTYGPTFAGQLARSPTQYGRIISSGMTGGTDAMQRAGTGPAEDLVLSLHEVVGS